VPAAQPRAALSPTSRDGAGAGDAGVSAHQHGVWQGSAGCCRRWRQWPAAPGWAEEDGGAAGVSSEAGPCLPTATAKRIREGFLWQRAIEFIILQGKTERLK